MFRKFRRAPRRKKSAWETLASAAAYCGDGPALERALEEMAKERELKR